ncbi:MAG: lysophospholipid acyltransferase family protein [Acidobacteriota bacterium]
MSFTGTSARAALKLVPKLSFATAGTLGRMLGYFAWAIDARHRNVAEQNLAEVLPHIPPRQRRRLARQAFGQVGRTAVELLWSPALRNGNMTSVGEFTGLHLLQRELRRGRGALLAGAHFGNWELMGLALGMLGVRLHVIARRIGNPELEKIIVDLRTRTGNHVIYKHDAVRGALRALRNGEAVAILIDQNTLRAHASFVPFFGKPAATSRLLAQLHLRTGAPVLPSFAVPEGRRYRFVLEPPLELEGSASAVMELATARVESYIRQHPQAWLWLHDRWRTRPQ